MKDASWHGSSVVDDPEHVAAGGSTSGWNGTRTSMVLLLMTVKATLT